MEAYLAYLEANIDCENRMKNYIPKEGNVIYTLHFFKPNCIDTRMKEILLRCNVPTLVAVSNKNYKGAKTLYFLIQSCDPT